MCDESHYLQRRDHQQGVRRVDDSAGYVDGDDDVDELSGHGGI